MKRLVPGEPVDIEPPSTSIFQVVISQRSGDGVCYKKETYNFSDWHNGVDAAEFVGIINAIMEVQKYGYGRDMHEVQTKLIDHFNLGVSIDDIIDICGFDGGGIALAAVDHFEVFWYDMYGRKFYAHLTDIKEKEEA